MIFGSLGDGAHYRYISKCRWASFSLGGSSNAMGILDWLFKKKATIELDDPVFGHLTFDEVIWSNVPGLAEEAFMITVDAPETGPSVEQRDFFEHVSSRLPDFERRARDYMRSGAHEGVDVSTLSTYSIEIGSQEETVRQEFVLELSDEDAFEIHRVYFSGDQAVDYGVDD